MANYLKKTKMHLLAQRLYADVPSIRKCSYKFYRGSEWLEFSLPCKVYNCSLIVEMYLTSNYLAIDENLYNWETDETKRLERRFYNGSKLRDLISSIN